MISEIFAAFGFGQKHAHVVSTKYAEASKLNAEFELNLNNAMNLLNSEHLRLQQRIESICQDTEEESLIASELEPIFKQLASEIDVGLATAKNTQKTIARSSRFASIRKWDECLSILHRHVAASRHQLDRIELMISQMNRVVDEAKQEISNSITMSVDLGLDASNEPT